MFFGIRDPKYTMRAWINLMDGLLGEDRIDDDEIPNPVYGFLASLVPQADENGNAISLWQIEIKQKNDE